MVQKDNRICRSLLEKYNREMNVLKNFIAQVSRILSNKLICVLLIGSRAKGDFNITSDIDLIMIGNWSNKILFERINEIDEKISLPLLPIDFFLYTPEEIKIFIEQGNPMILDGFTEGICLYNYAYYHQVRKLIKEHIKLGNISKIDKIWKINNPIDLNKIQ
ncbi:MAG: nucleotidyltransferase domain-containing protein [Promethearchaeia archaeon]